MNEISRRLLDVSTMRLAEMDAAGVCRVQVGGLGEGKLFLVAVSPDVRASGIPWPGGCPVGTMRPVAGGLLTAHCLAGGRYLYTTRRPGSATVIATLRPRCAPGSVCPQWITEPRLAVVIS